MKHLLFLTVVCLFTTTVTATVYVDGFEYPEPATDMWTTPDGIFTHRIAAAPGPAGPFWNIIDTISGSDGQALALYPASDTIVFNLPAGEYVDFVSLDYVWLGGTTEIKISGTDNIYTLNPSGDNLVWKHLDTTGLGLGEIYRIELYSYEGAFDNITLNTVPEPATLVLMGLGAVVLHRRRK